MFNICFVYVLIYIKQYCDCWLMFLALLLAVCVFPGCVLETNEALKSWYTLIIKRTFNCHYVVLQDFDWSYTVSTSWCTQLIKHDITTSVYHTFTVIMWIVQSALVWYQLRKYVLCFFCQWQCCVALELTVSVIQWTFVVTRFCVYCCSVISLLTGQGHGARYANWHSWDVASQLSLHD